MRALPVVCCLIAVLAAASPAAADTLAFVRGGNVWLSNADGSGQYQVTLDGTAANPYSSPSQADDGTVVALRTPPAGRPQIVRMSQSGGLLNAPINTPAPGTGAIDAKVSPDGTKVAYWFVTTVFDPTCTFCVDITNRALISWSSRFTGPTEIGTPNTGGWPSWIGNATLLLTNGSATAWYYTIGRPEAQQWYADNGPMGNEFVGVVDGDVSRDGARLVMVRGDSQETLRAYATTGPPPAVPAARCQWTGPAGKFSSPSWATTGALAWQEADGVWVAPVPADLSSCPSGGLVLPGATEPAFGPAALSPGPRPGCGNPGNPAACPAGTGPATGPTTTAPKPTTTTKMTTKTPKDPAGVTLAKTVKATSFKNGVTLKVKVKRKGTVKATAKVGSKVLATRTVKAKRKGTVSLRLKASGKVAAKLKSYRGKRLVITIRTPTGKLTVRRTLK